MPEENFESNFTDIYNKFNNMDIDSQTENIEISFYNNTNSSYDNALIYENLDENEKDSLNKNFTTSDGTVVMTSSGFKSTNRAWEGMSRIIMNNLYREGITFDATKDFVTRLPDGSELTIPGDSVNVADDLVTNIRLVITPNSSTNGGISETNQTSYGYSLQLYDDTGKEIEGNFKKDVIISIPVDINAIQGMDSDNIEGMYYSTTQDTWDKAKTSTWDEQSSQLNMTLDHF